MSPLVDRAALGRAGHTRRCCSPTPTSPQRSRPRSPRSGATVVDDVGQRHQQDGALPMPRPRARRRSPRSPASRGSSRRHARRSRQRSARSGWCRPTSTTTAACGTWASAAQGQVVMTSDSGIDVDARHVQRPGACRSPTSATTRRTARSSRYKKGAHEPGDRVRRSRRRAVYPRHATPAGTIAGNDEPTRRRCRRATAWRRTRRSTSWTSAGTTLANGVDAVPDDLNDLFLPPYTGNARRRGAHLVELVGRRRRRAPTRSTRSRSTSSCGTTRTSTSSFSNGNAGTPGTVGSPASAKNSPASAARSNGTLDQARSTPRPAAARRADGRRKPTFCAPGQSVTSATRPARTHYAALSRHLDGVPVGHRRGDADAPVPDRRLVSDRRRGAGQRLLALGGAAQGDGGQRRRRTR